MALIQRVKKQLGKDIDNSCTPVGSRGAPEAPFCDPFAKYGYTVVRTGATSSWSLALLHKTELYRTSQQAQGSAFPDSLGARDWEAT